MEEGKPLFIATHLEPEQWNNLPADVGIWHSYNSEQSHEERELIRSKIIPVLIKLMSEYLTPRQFEVMKLYHLDFHCTQNITAQVLRITQPTVNQHLNGKRRHGKKIGGAYLRLRRKVKKITEFDDIDISERKTLKFLGYLVETDLSYRKRQMLFNALR